MGYHRRRHHATAPPRPATATPTAATTTASRRRRQMPAATKAIAPLRTLPRPGSQPQQASSITAPPHPAPRTSSRWLAAGVPAASNGACPADRVRHPSALQKRSPGVVWLLHPSPGAGRDRPVEPAIPLALALSIVRCVRTSTSHATRHMSHGAGAPLPRRPVPLITPAEHYGARIS